MKCIQGKKGRVYKGREEVYTRERRKCIQEKRGSIYKGEMKCIQGKE